MRALLPTGGLLVVDRGFFSFAWLESLTATGQFFLTRWREQAVFAKVQVFGPGPRCRDRLVRVGQHHRPPCQHPVRLVSVRWDTAWRHYVTNVVDPARLSARQVVELYARRWRSEDAFLLTKRLLGLSYLWCSHPNGVAIQLYATWLIYLMLNELMTDVAVPLSLPLERISYEMVFRSLPFVYRAQQRGEAGEAAAYLAAHADLLGLIKPVRPSQRAREQNHQALWTPARQHRAALLWIKLPPMAS